MGEMTLKGGVIALVGLVGAVLAIETRLEMVAVYEEGHRVAQNGGSVSEVTPYITEIILLTIAAIIPISIGAALWFLAVDIET
jgi:hypothetical protein